MALGLVEVVGLTAATVVADAMAKAAGVRLGPRQEIGDGMVAVVVVGSIGDVQAAVEVGAEVARQSPDRVAQAILGRPFEDVLRAFFGPAHDRPWRPGEVRSGIER